MPPSLFEYTERNQEPIWVYVFGRLLFLGVHPLLMYRYEINAIYSGRSRPSDKGVVGGGGGGGRSPNKFFGPFGP